MSPKDPPNIAQANGLGWGAPQIRQVLKGRSYAAADTDASFDQDLYTGGILNQGGTTSAAMIGYEALGLAGMASRAYRKRR